MQAAARIGGTRETMNAWLSEFDREFNAAIAPSQEPGRRMQDESFIPRQIDTCNAFLLKHGAALEAALRQ